MCSKHSCLKPAVLVLVVSFSASASAGFRCKSVHLIQEGDSASYVRNSCGSPMNESSLRDADGYPIGKQLRYVDETDRSWVYVVDIVDGTVTRISTERQ